MACNHMSMVCLNLTSVSDKYLFLFRDFLRPDGLKKAYVRLSPDQEAADVANKLGII